MAICVLDIINVKLCYECVILSYGQIKG